MKVVATDAVEGRATGRIGFMRGRISVPDDFDRMGEAKIGQLFGIDGLGAA